MMIRYRVKHAACDEGVSMDSWNTAMGLIEEHLTVADGDLDINDLARTAFTTEHHFRRMFSSLAGMPLSGYIRRRRLTVAAAEIVDGDDAIQDIAVKYGYSSADAFSRAFRVIHGIGPTQARETGATLWAQPRLIITLTIDGPEQVNYRLETKDPFTVVGRSRRIHLVCEGPNQEMIQFHREVGLNTTRAIAGFSTIEPAGVLSVSTDIAEDRAEGSTLEYWIGAATDAAPANPQAGNEPFDVLNVPAHTWLVLTSDGPETEQIQQLWVDAYGKWFPANPYSTVPGPEIVTTLLDANGHHTHSELWLPVERNS